ncbi:MAG: glycosyltransferase family 4 protein [Cytophaga sp.]|uniref:glycosyltransferase family 4 protein n=1 Tax=Cytophaga sp. TaxID=29535 RepID=UPI003F7E50A1
MKISYVSTFDPADVSYWSGLGHNMAKMLEGENADMEYVSNVSSKLRYPLKVKGLLYRNVLRKEFDINREPMLARQYAKEIQQRLSSNTDVIFSPSTIPVSLLETKKPKVIYTDATFAAMLGFYESFSNYCKETIKHGNYLEQMALDSSQLIIYSSDWAAKSAAEHYKINPDKIKVVPFGANMPCDRNLDDIKTIVTSRSTDTLHLLFLAVDWQRKGGDLALNIVRRLNEAGVKTKLHVVGVRTLPFERVPDCIVNHGYISKGTKEGINKLERLFRESHFLLLPSVADCTPIVYSEANSFGLACITTNVGGIPTIVRDDVNGKVFSLSEPSGEWAAYIASIFSNKKAYESLCLSSFAEYENRLNWKTAGRTIMGYMKEL